MGPGLKRLVDIDNAQAKLLGLGHSADDVKLIMDNALASVKGTAFGLGEAATVAATAVAAGIKPGADLQRTLSLTADAATIAGVSMTEMSGIFGDVATSGQVTGTTLDMLNSRGIPALQLLAKSLGVSQQAASDMVSAGQVDFAQFQDAIEQGMGGAALKSGETFSGSLANVQAALGRLGASALSGAFPALQQGFQKLIAQLDKLGPSAEKIGATLTPMISALVNAVIGLVGWFSGLGAGMQVFVLGTVAAAAALGPTLIAVGKLATGLGSIIKFMDEYNVVQKVMTAVQKVAAAAQWALNAAMDANPIGLIILAIAALVAGLIWFFTQTDLGRDIWANFTKFIGEAWNNVVSFLTTTLGAIGDFFVTIWTNISNFVQTVVGAIVNFLVSAFNGIAAWWNGLWTGIMNFLTPIFSFIALVIQTYVQIWMNIFLVLAAVLVTIWNGIVAVVMAVWNAIAAFITPIIQFITSVISTELQIIQDVWNSVWNAISNFFQTIWQGFIDFLTPIALAMFNFISQTVQNIQNVWNAVWGAISGFFEGVWNGFLAFVTPIILAIYNVISTTISRVQSIWSSVWGGISSFFSGIWNGMVGFVSDGVGRIFSFIGGIQSTVMGIFSGVGGWLLQVGRDLMQGMINGIVGMFKNVTKAIGDVVNGAIDWAKSVLGIHSPSTVFKNIGVNTMQGLVDGIASMVPTLNAQMDSISTGLSTSLQANVNGLPSGEAGSDGRPNQNFTYVAAPGSSLGSQDELFSAMRMSKVLVPGW